MKEVKKENKIISKDWKDNMDYDFCDLSIDGTSNDMVSQQVLAMRASWRLAQRKVMNEQSFMVLKQEEYRKKL